MEKMTFWQFFQECELYYIRTKKQIPSIRLGQVMFNYLLDCNEELAEQIRGTNSDPFYLDKREDNKEKWDQFCDFIRENF